MILVYSITNKDVSIYDKSGQCVLVTSKSIEEVIKEYHIKNADIHITL